MNTAQSPIAGFGSRQKQKVNSSDDFLIEKRPYQKYVPELLLSYEKIGGLNHADDFNMPSKRAVGAICEDFLQILFPGFHDDNAVQKVSFSELTSVRFNHLALRLEEQVRKAVRVGNPPKTYRKNTGNYG